MGLIGKIFGATDYSKGAVHISGTTLCAELHKAFTFSNDFTPIQRIIMFADRDYLVMEHGNMLAWVNKYHTSLHGFGGYIPQTLDCDDHEAMFAGDRVKGRWKSGLKSVEAIGWIDYHTKKGVFHRAAWACSQRGGSMIWSIYQPQIGVWNDKGEVKIAVAAGA